LGALGHAAFAASVVFATLLLGPEIVATLLDSHIE